MRYAIYYTPGSDAELTQRAASWLGRDAFTGNVIPPLTQIDPALMADARRYGFHATLKPPFRLADGQSEEALLSALKSFCATRRRFETRLVVSRIDRFFALTPEQVSTDLQSLADDAVTAFEQFRASLTAAEIERRRPDHLSPRQRENLDRWGYPYVFDQFRFHMTLTDRIAETDASSMQAVLERVFTPVLSKPIAISSLALFIEPEPAAPFVVRAFAELGEAR